jgi:tRNA modification GTPase
LDAPGNTVVYGWITDPSRSAVRVDQVLVSVYRAPVSYTGEDSADISCHGGAVAETVLASLAAAGFVRALPGEFTFRAFMNGKLDLTRAESVMELVSAETKEAAGRALDRLEGALERELSAVKEKILDALAAVEIRLDYPDEEIDGGGEDWRPCAAEALSRLSALVESYHGERLYAEGALAVIAGRPNAGKSSLFNALLDEERSIVTEEPGTTRDWIEARISLEGIPLRLADTAGLRRTEEGMGIAETLGIRRSRELLAQADIVVYVIDGTVGLTREDQAFLEEDHPGVPVLPIWNKADIIPIPTGNGGPDRFTPLITSAAAGTGLQQLCSAIHDALMNNAYAGKADREGMCEAGIAVKRHKDLAERAAAALREALASGGGLDAETTEDSLELTAPLLREALNELGEITGEVTSASILNTIFSRFCVGK